MLFQEQLFHLLLIERLKLIANGTKYSRMDQVKFVDDNLSIFSPNTGKYGPERLLIWTLLTQFGHQQIDEAISVKFISANTFFARIKKVILPTYAISGQYYSSTNYRNKDTSLRQTSVPETGCYCNFTHCWSQRYPRL